MFDDSALDATPRRPRILIVDDEPEFCEELQVLLAGAFRFHAAHDGDAAVRDAARLAPDVVLLDIDLGQGESGLDVLLRIRELDAAPPVIMLTGDDRIATAVRALRLGAYHYLTKPPDLDALTGTVLRAIGDQLMRRRLHSVESDLQRYEGDLVVACAAMSSLLERVDKVAPTEATVLITGESGTGKELIAKRIHARSSRCDGPFIAVNCGAVPSELIESEFFGHEAKAFNEAKLRRGKLELAAGGTLFLDEIGDSPLNLQVKLLRALEERRFCRVGGEVELDADIRLVAATSKDLEAEIKAKTFREDLYYRLNVFPLHVPPLRERPEDVVPIALHHVAMFARRDGKTIEGLTPAARQSLATRSWPGNVRELRNIIEHAVVMCEGEQIDIGDVAVTRRGAPLIDRPYPEAKKAALEFAFEHFRHDYLASLLQACQGNISRAAARSGLSRGGLQEMIKEAGIDPEDFR